MDIPQLMKMVPHGVFPRRNEIRGANVTDWLGYFSAFLGSTQFGDGPDVGRAGIGSSTWVTTIVPTLVGLTGRAIHFHSTIGITRLAAEIVVDTFGGHT